MTTTTQPPGHAAPSQRLINEAALIVYERWRRYLSHDEALEQAALFALRAGAIVTRAHVVNPMVLS